MVLAAETGEPRYFYCGPGHGRSVTIPLTEKVDCAPLDTVDLEELFSVTPMPVVVLEFELFTKHGWPKPQYVVLLDAESMKRLDSQDSMHLCPMLTRLP